MPSVARNYLTCEADFPTEGGWIGDSPDPENPPGQEPTVFFHQSLRGVTTRFSDL